MTSTIKRESFDSRENLVLKMRAKTKSAAKRASEKIVGKIVEKVFLSHSQLELLKAEKRKEKLSK